MQTVRIVEDGGQLVRETIDVLHSTIVDRQPWAGFIALPVTIVIRAKNEAATLDQVLQAVNAQIGGAAHGGSVEVILVDDNSTDDTVAIARRYGARIITLAPDSFTWGGALNLGVQAATSDLVVCLSGHAVPTDSLWLANLCEPMAADTTLAATFGLEQNWPNATLPDVVLGWCKASSRRTFFYLTGGIGFTDSNNCLRRSVALEIPFDERLPASEDFAWADAAIRAGWRVLHVPNAGVWHSHYLGLLGALRLVGSGTAGSLQAGQPR